MPPIGSPPVNLLRLRRLPWSALLCLIVLTLVGLPARAADSFDSGHVRVRLSTDRASVAPGEAFRAAVTLVSIPHWHTYWKNPGDTGLPTRITWTLPAGVEAGAIDWPLPARLPTPPLMSFGYEGQIPLLVPMRTSTTLQGPLVLRAKVRWLVCAEQCIPESADLSLDLPVRAGSPAESHPSADAAALDHAAALLPQAATGWTIRATRDGHWLRLDGALPDGQAAPPRLVFFPEQKGLIAPAAPQPYHHAGSRFSLAVPFSTEAPPPADLSAVPGLLVTGSQGEGRQGWTVTPAVSGVTRVELPDDNGAADLTARDGAAAASGAVGTAAGAGPGLALALVFAFVGGLLLNLMPCVLPVLSLKVFALIGDAGAPRARSTLHGALFLGGVLVSFWALAGLLLVLKSAGAAVGWGFQLQSPVFVALLATLFGALTLNFAGLFELGTGLQAQAGDLEQSATRGRSAALGAFASGVLTTLVATPCTAPFLGAGIGFTLQQSAFQAILVFTAMALGVGLPVSLLAFFPQWLSRVPRPGLWMETLRQVFAFPMLLTVIWLCWVLGHQLGVDAMAVLLVGLALTTLAAWLYGRAQRAQLQGRGGRLGATTAALALGLAVVLAMRVPAFGDVPVASGSPVTNAAANAGQVTAASAGASAPAADWQPYSADRLAELRAAGRPVFVDFTAAWCLSCQVNKRTSLRSADVVARLHALGVATLEADWTNSDPQITAALAALQRNAVPVYAVYPKGGGTPELLPEVLTPSVVLAALDRAVR